MLDEGDMKKIGEMWYAYSLVSRHRIEDSLVDYLLKKGTTTFVVSNSLSDYLVEVVEEKLLQEGSEGHKIQAMIERRCFKSKKNYSKTLVRQDNALRIILTSTSTISGGLLLLTTLEAEMKLLNLN